MKKYISVLLLAVFCLAVFCGCSKAQCDHEWQTIGTHDHEIVVEVCSKCEETRSRPFTEEDDDHDHDHDHDHNDTESSSVTIPNVPNSKFPATPPLLFVFKGNTGVSAWMGTYTWYVTYEDGTAEHTDADSAHPLDCLEDIGVVEVTAEGKVNLFFEAVPTSVTVKIYKADAKSYDEYEEIVVADNTLTVIPGDYVYEITASWNEEGESYSGIASYAFRTEK